MSLVRSVAAIVAGMLLAYGLPWLLERVLVESLAGRNLQSADEYYALRNTGGVLAARVGMAVFLGILAGHTAARVARDDAVRTVAIAAAALSMVLMWEFTGGEFASATPMWMRVALVAVTGPAMVFGAYVRAAVAQLKENP